ncbi:hypothetical protein [Candidatus Tisiphia endosymbiont of Melanophora roralis]|jgi:hypothetical protein|uniref:hypothetical protein n=1 Tax=Candidatus Tisiphia endosymbiont of Melanophora roralis TaxID=3066261 RepID=UPI001E6F22FE|nr:MAG: hypothetical protein LF884_02845 [Rickettsia endosymbiont of Cimex lectularius]
MKDFNTKVISKYTERLKGCFVSLSSECIVSCKYPSTLKRSLRTFNIIKILQQNSDLLDYLSLDSQKNLLSVLEHYGPLSIETLKQQKYQMEEVTNFVTSLNQLVDCLKSSSTLHHEENNKALKPVMDLARNFVQHCCILIIEDVKNQDVINNLQATAIVLNLDNLSLEQQNLLLDQLLFIKELWQIDSTIDIKKESVPLLFHANILLTLKEENTVDYEYIFKKITNFLIDDHNVLMELTNAKLICLYNRLKDLCIKSQTINHILLRIHDESKFRKSFSKLNNSGYELSVLFENYNAIIHQIENAEFAIIERFLLRQNVFMHEILINITKHIDAIRMLNITEDSDLNYILAQIRKRLTQNIQSGHTISLMISSIESKFSAKLEVKIIKRYASLDSFTKNALKTRYQLLFKNITSLLKKELNYAEFVQQVITCRIAADYKINSNVTSVRTLRLIEQERLEVKKQLCEINFVETFSDKYLNKTSSLSFKKHVRRTSITTPAGYVTVIIRILLTNFSVEQLQLLSQFLMNGNLTTIRTIVQQELVVQVKKRTTISKVIYYVFTRKKNELTMLNNIKRILNEYTNLN